MSATLRTIILFCLLCAGVSAHAATVHRVDVRGLSDAEMVENVRVALSLEDALNKPVTARRLNYLLQVAEDEAREALEPFGYYSPTITVQRNGSDDALHITIDIAPGTPVKVRNSAVGIEGAGGADRYLKQEIAAFQPQPGQVFDHRLYEAGKVRISRRLAERGYFDADFLARKVEVTRAVNAADIELRWDSGDRYDMGAVTFAQTPRQIIDPALLEKLIYWNEGEYYHQGRLDRLRKSLVRLDYFESIDIQPLRDQAVDKQVPVHVELVPAKRSIYTLGASFGTDSGAGFSAGVERRYLNSRGHKALAQLDYAQKRKTMTLQYRVPAFAWLDGWYTGSLQYADEQTDYIDLRRLELVASRSGEYSSKLNLVASLHVLRTRWAYEYENDGDPATPALYRFANYVFPALHAEYISADNRMLPRHGFGGNVMLRGGIGNARDDAIDMRGNNGFAQLHARGSWFRGLDAASRVIVRGELGHTFTDALVDLPPSLRFYAGGDRSIRGYQWREVGPRVLDKKGKPAFALGARNVITTSLEVERYFTAQWGAAVFVDAGDAFDGKRPDMHVGVGIGLRWKSPVGPVRVDIARGLKDPDSPFTLHLNIGADL